MDPPYTILEHPSDIGIEARGKTLAEAYQYAAAGLISLIIDPATVQPSGERYVAVSAADRESLLVKWLSEILYLYDGQGFICRDFEIRHFSPTELTARVRGELISARKHRTKSDIKAVTYHQLAVSESPDGGIVRFFLDI